EFPLLDLVGVEKEGMSKAGAILEAAGEVVDDEVFGQDDHRDLLGRTGFEHPLLEYAAGNPLHQDRLVHLLLPTGVLLQVLPTHVSAYSLGTGCFLPLGVLADDAA